MFSYKKLIFVLLMLVFSLLMPNMSELSGDSLKYILIASGVFLLVLYYLYRTGWLDEEKMKEKIAEKWEKEEHEALNQKNEEDERK